MPHAFMQGVVDMGEAIQFAWAGLNTRKLSDADGHVFGVGVRGGTHILVGKSMEEWYFYV